jgi:hypothetical protein
MSTGMDSLTMAEIHKAETIAGKSIQQLGDNKAPNARLMTAIAFVIKQRTDKTIVFEKFEEGTTLNEVMAVIGGGDEDQKK